VRIPLAPTPLPAMGHTILAYELHLSSLAPIELGLSHIDVYVDGRDARRGLSRRRAGRDAP
jgi:hypothetical protein